jgi:2Fe-2S ferredoxin
MSEANQKIFPPISSCASPFSPKARRSSSNSAHCPTITTASRCRFSMWRRTSTFFLDHACGGVCACTTCHLWIKDQTGISEADDDEIDRMDMAADQQLNSRLGCQAVITKPGDLRSRNSQVEPQLRFRGQAADAWLKASKEKENAARDSVDRRRRDRHSAAGEVPDMDPLTVRFTDRYVTELPGFADDPAKSNASA